MTSDFPRKGDQMANALQLQNRASMRTVISLVGTGGVGKTALASKVYDNEVILALSSDDLPHHLKSCFLFFGMFPENYSIADARIYRLWTAEGFVKRKKDKRYEDIAEEYLDELIHRNLVQVSYLECQGYDTVLKVHDMMQEIILLKTDELDAPLDSLPKEVGDLFHLKYLGLRNAKVKKLLKSVGPWRSKMANALTPFADIKIQCCQKLETISGPYP
ncbi:hypothetical protein TIFTF001_032526 [Ficus carica]|uniref:Disease resistance protein winged helix domain-containing protein n=1 Tax=Ficus carica TaxID=3494 RepID=A0AA88J6T9_FICCA|nr:hypothetical protein TIFTF001_032526 [Ficus carica]